MFRRPISTPPTDCHDSAVMPEEERLHKTIFQGMQTSSHLQKKVNVSVAAMPLRKIMIICVVPCTALPLLSVPAVTQEQKQMPSASRRGKSDQGERRANTGLSLHTLPVGIISFEGGT